MKRVLSVASEAVPLVKTGGLADVVGALPGALLPQGWHMRVMIPAYPGVLDRIGAGDPVWGADNFFGGTARVCLGQVGETSVLALDAPHLYDRPGGPYGDSRGEYWDNAERFAALSWAAAVISREGVEGWKPEVVHAHDWQAGLLPAFLRYWNSGIPTVMTIHNIAFQGRFGPMKMGPMRLPPEWFQREGYEFWGDISTLKAGLMAADAITTVSPRYAEELMRGEFGLGLEGVMQLRSGVVEGILNGVDTAVWDPAGDRGAYPYSVSRLAGKARNRKALLAEFGLDPDLAGPLAVVVSRLTAQKGIDLVHQAIPDFVAGGGALAVLGTGDAWAEDQMRELAWRYPGRVGVRIGYDEALSHQMFAGGDAVLVPSRFEPCGLTQMYGLRYGCVPVVSAVGGLADTVIGATPASEAAGAATGIVFHPVDALGLRQALHKLLALHADRAGWQAMVRRGMKADWSWNRSAARYAALYDRLIGA
ncbi:glycogen synthase GlgA [Paenirhodobacter populi]|uniref:Glycogen synthase n=1 Tax=Paenirhodobacter populi TaxID=2306993 RepID=A0A443JVG9_9RHOB|nr:glycogen synthase GlgA [Sinirhodobacter populi]RWR24491.1 glycogen synthase GlgA [Sinirhodobacter populi]